MSEPAIGMRASPGWILNRGFDSAFIFATAAIAFLSGLLVVFNASLFGLILFLDIWLLGYHHVISTYTRLCFDRESFRQHRFLLFGLPPLVLATCIALAWGVGIWVLTTIYLYWQWFHYTRQSWGIAQVYRRKAVGAEMESEWFLKAAFYLLPLAGILYRSNQAPETFLGAEVVVLPVPDFVVTTVSAAAVAALFAFAWSRYAMARRGRMPLAHTAFMATHCVIFTFGYVMIPDVTYGWLVINIWHNAQYILFVWLYNNRRFKGGIAPQARFLSAISQTRFWPFYLAVCLGLSSALYYAISLGQEALATIAVPLIVVYQTINFHHYIVDGLIWKARQKPLRLTLGLS